MCMVSSQGPSVQLLLRLEPHFLVLLPEAGSLSPVQRLYRTDASLEGAVSPPLGSSSLPAAVHLRLFFQQRVSLACMDGTVTVQQVAGTQGACVYVWHSHGFQKQSTALASTKPWDWFLEPQKVSFSGSGSERLIIPHHHCEHTLKLCLCTWAIKV